MDEIDGINLLEQLKELAPKLLPFAQPVWKKLNEYKAKGKKEKDQIVMRIEGNKK